MNVIEEYVSQFPEDKQEKLREIWQIIKDAAPEATERISWQMPTFYLNGNLVHFALHKSHIGFYPGENGVKYFTDKLSEYKYSKGAIQFPLSKPLPKELITEIVTFRVEENTKK